MKKSEEQHNVELQEALMQMDCYRQRERVTRALEDVFNVLDDDFGTVEECREQIKRLKALERHLEKLSTTHGLRPSVPRGT